MLSLLSAIPSPSSGTLEIGPVNLNAYGLMIALGVVAAVRIAGKRAERINAASMDDMSSIALWAVPAGVLGGRVMSSRCGKVALVFGAASQWVYS
jgi:prolipoprotein diacylglyceryltransferase